MWSLLFFENDMKKTIFFLSMTLILVSGCANDRKSEKKAVKKVAYEYIWALANFNVTKAERYATEETKRETLKVAKSFMENVDRKVIEQDLPAKVRITNVKLTSDTTATAVWHKKTPRKKNSKTIELRKRNGKWQAHDLIRPRKNDKTVKKH